MAQGLLCAAVSSSTAKEMVLWKQKVHHWCHKNLSLDPALSQFHQFSVNHHVQLYYAHFKYCQLPYMFWPLQAPFIPSVSYSMAMSNI
jgi:hypothetical protein